MLKNKKSNSRIPHVRTNIRILSIILLTCIGGSCLYLGLDHMLNRIGNTIARQYEHNADDISDAYAQITVSLRSDFDDFVKYSAIKDKNNTVDYGTVVSSEIRNMFPWYTEPSDYIYPDGSVKGFSGRSAESYKFFQYFKNHKNLNNDYVLNVENSKCFIEPGYSVKDGKTPVIIFAYPELGTNGRLNGVYLSQIPLVTLSEALKENFAIGKYGDICLFTDDGTIFVHPDKNFLLKKYVDEKSVNKITQKTNLFVDRVNFGSEKYVFSEKVADLDWNISIVLPDEEMNLRYKNINSEKTQTAILFVVIFMVLLILMNVITYIVSNHYDSHIYVYSQDYFELRATKRLQKKSGSRFLLISADIRGLKFINQKYGIEVGDDIIVRFARALKSFAKNHKGFCSHSYADNIFVFFEIDSISEALDSFSDELKEISDAIKTGEFPVIPKYGLSIIDPVSKEMSRQRKIKHFVGKAMFANSLIKTKVNKSFEIYSPKIEEKIQHEQLIEQELDKAVKNNEFFVVYQPKINLENEKIVGAEALVRWRSSNPDLGLLSPIKFIPVFEKNGFIEELDFIVYEKVFKFIKKQLELKNPIIPISVNLSRVHISTKKFKEFFARFMNLFNSFNIPSNLVEIEILEQSASEDSEFLTRVIDAFHTNGFSVAMDDFGSGESSLNMLSSIPIDVVKFDQNFLRRQQVAKNGSEDIITTLVNLGKVLKKRTVFEGVETEEQKEFLKKIECDVVQGFFYSKPLEEGNFVNFIKAHL